MFSYFYIALLGILFPQFLDLGLSLYLARTLPSFDLWSRSVTPCKIPYSVILHWVTLREVFQVEIYPSINGLWIVPPVTLTLRDLDKESGI